LRIDLGQRGKKYYTVGGAASDLGIRNGIQPWHDCMNIKAKTMLAANGFKIPRAKIVRLI
jgi:hypothetical protein